MPTDLTGMAHEGTIAAAFAELVEDIDSLEVTTNDLHPNIEEPPSPEVCHLPQQDLLAAAYKRQRGLRLDDGASSPELIAASSTSE